MIKIEHSRWLAQHAGVLNDAPSHVHLRFVSDDGSCDDLVTPPSRLSWAAGRGRVHRPSPPFCAMKTLGGGGHDPEGRRPLAPPKPLLVGAILSELKQLELEQRQDDRHD